MKLKPKIYETTPEKKKDFWIGVGLFFGLNILMSLCGLGLSVGMTSMMYTPDGTTTALADVYPAVSCILGALPLLINIGLIVYFAFTRTQIALGMVAGFGIAFLLTLCLGLIFTAWCFYALSTSGY